MNILTILSAARCCKVIIVVKTVKWVVVSKIKLRAILYMSLKNQDGEVQIIGLMSLFKHDKPVKLKEFAIQNNIKCQLCSGLTLLMMVVVPKTVCFKI